jgi:hypothetical protein
MLARSVRAIFADYAEDNPLTLGFRSLFNELATFNESQIAVQFALKNLFAIYASDGIGTFEKLHSRLTHKFPSKASVSPKRLHRFDGRGSSCGNECREHTAGGQKHADRDDSYRVVPLCSEEKASYGVSLKH